ncbi:MAG: VCBS repeat-containing protein [Pirellulales bacterium]|nr:VCBS repeat-containing protein [Pirellulales bacterium]
MPLSTTGDPAWLSNHTYMSDAVIAAVQRAVDLESYDVEDLALVSQWVVGLDTANGAVLKADSLGADYISEAPFLDKLSIWEFPSEENWQTVVDTLTSAEGVDFFYPLVPQDIQPMMIPNDTLFNNQWHLLNTGQNGGMPGEDANVVPAWDLVTGEGVFLGVIDDGFQTNHPDLVAHYQSSLDWDYVTNDDDPSPDLDEENHGTAVMGVAGAVGNNNLGVSGAAPDADLVGIRIDLHGIGAFNDANEASALSHENQIIDIYNNSWGRTAYYYPTGPLSIAALENGITNGRGGLGNIYLFAAGNSRMEDGNANYYGEQASRYTIAVAGIGNTGDYAVYSNPGANLLISTQTDGIYTTDRTGEDGRNGSGDMDPLADLDYTSTFNGTSSACPLASGVVALMLEANPYLTYRDVQSILVNTARMNDPAEPDWTTNGAGYHINHNYGFGAIDATAAVNAALTWQTLSEEVSTESGVIPVGVVVPDNANSFLVSEATLNDAVTDIEWVEVTVDIDHPYSGDLEVILTSPSGTQSVLASGSDQWWMFPENGLRNWTFTTARHWGESSEGIWTLQVRDVEPIGEGTWYSWSIKAYGENISNVTPPEPTSPVGPELISVKPNSGSAITDGDLLHVGPRELKFTFNEGQTIDEATLSSIKMMRAGGDGVLDNANDVVVDYGWIGLGERPNEIVVRFAETLPDDLYRITIVGAGDEPLANSGGIPFHKGEDVSITFDLDLGALVTAIVPQPTYRDASGNLQQHRDKIVVYFNSDTLDKDSAENADFYRLTVTGQTADTSDDVEIVPQSVIYDSVSNTVELTFSDDLANLGAGAFQLRIGNEWREIGTSAQDATTVGDTFLAATDLGMLGSVTDAQSIIISSEIEPQPYDLEWPGAISEIGHRDLPLSLSENSHYYERYFAKDDQYGITTIAYNFQDYYGNDPAGNPLHNLISEPQKERAREIMELYGYYFGVQFIETATSGLTIATGDMRALNPFVDTGPGGTVYLAGNGVAIMDAAEDWNESLYGGEEANWFATAMEAIGHLLGLGYADDMDPTTIMGSDFNDLYNGDAQYYLTTNELVYPGNQDIVHGQHIFRPDSNDVDIYKFEIEQSGKFSAETIAERLDDSSLLDSNLKLYDDANNMIAGNDDYYSEDSYVEVYLQPGTYYVAVSSTGNDQYDPRVAGSGIGGTTQGQYDLRVTFTPDVGEHLSDTTGTWFDGDADGVPGGVHNFWFNVQPLASTIFVDKIADGGIQDGSLANPYREIDVALAAAGPDDIVRIVGNYDRAYIDQVEYDTGLLSNGLAAGDLNGDGWRDIVTTVRNELGDTNYVSILFGVGDGTFWAPVSYEVGEGPLAVELGDLDSDGDLDIIVANGGENTLSRLGNLGDGTFERLPRLFVGFGPSDLALGDLNNDGDLDIVAANTTDNTVSILLSNGMGGFLDQDVHDVGNAPSGVALGDFDNNQRLDVIVANSADDTINVLLNEENIRTKETEFEVQAAIPVGSNPSAVAAGDLTGDGMVDVVVVNTGDNNISVLSGQGDGTFATAVDYGVGNAPTDVKLAKLDNNDTLDVVVTNGADDTVSVMFTLPDESLETPVEYGVGDAPGYLALADMDNDGVIDILTNNTDGDSVSVLMDHRDAAYEIGFDLLGRPLEDGWRMEVPQGVTVMVDAGAVFKLRQANIDVGSSTQGVDRSEGALQVLGTPDLSVYFTSFHNKLMAQDHAQFDVPAAGGDWGGLVFRNKLDYEENATAPAGEERTILEEEGIFLNYVNHANITYGGGQVVVNSSSDIYSPLHMEEARPTLTYNTLTQNADAAMSADPNSFADTKFQSNDFTADYDRVGPEIHGNYIVDNSINGIFIRVNTNAGKAMDELEVCARWDDLDIAHVVLENLVISGTPGGPVYDEAHDLLFARQDGRLTVDPGILVKLDATRIEAEMGAQLIAEGNESYPIVFTSLDDDRYGMGGTFDTSKNTEEVIPAPGDWGGIYFAPVSSGSIANALFAFAGGVTPIEGGFAGFNTIEIHQGDVRITDSVFEYNTSEASGNNFRNGRNTATDALIFVRGAQPIIAGNTMWNNDAIAISIDANSLKDEQITDWGRSRGENEAYGDYQNNCGPMVRENHLSNNELNGLLVRGATLTTSSVWDDTDIVHILQDEIVIPNHHTYSGLRLQSQAHESLVVKLQGTNAGFTALGTPSEIEDRVGGTLQVIGAAGFPVVFTSLADDSYGAGYDPWGNLLTDTDNGTRQPSAGDWRSIKLERYVNDRNVAIVTEKEKPAGIADDVNSLPVTSQELGALAWSEMSGDDNLRLGFDVHGFIRSDDSTDVDVYSFKAEAGVEVWLDIDRTTMGLDTVIELVDANGNVFARSDNSEAERKGEQELYGLARSMDRDAWDINDQYTTNPHDAGMRVVLPGPAGQTRTFFVRVSSKDGQSSGGYQLQVRLREAQEYSGSYINMSSIHYATNGIEMLGLPTHSPLVGTTSELEPAGTGDGNGSNNEFDEAQYIGNLLYSDQNSLQVSGNMDGEGDIDWYCFDVDLQDIDPTVGIQWPTVFDIDYADGMSRPDLALWVYESDGTLIYASDDSNIIDDRAGPAAGADTDDLDRGSLGPFDPYLGTVLLPEGDNMTYYVAVTTQARVPTALDQARARLEPITSIVRVAEGHMDESPGDDAAEDVIPDSPTTILQVHPDEFALNDVVLYVCTGNDLYTVDPYTGEMETDVTAENLMPDSAGSLAAYYGDIAMRSDGRLFTFVTDIVSGGDRDILMDYRQISTANDNGGLPISSQDTGINTFVMNDDFTDTEETDEGTIHFNALAHQEGDEQYIYAVGNSDSDGPFVKNLLYKFNSDGTAIQKDGEGIEDRLPTDIIPLASLTTGLALVGVPATSSISIDRDITDGMYFEIEADDGTNNETRRFEFDLGLDVRLAEEGAAAVRDGDTFTLNNKTFEFNSGAVIVVSDWSVINDGTTITIRDSQNETLVFEIDNNGQINGAGNEPILIEGMITNEDVTTAIIEAINDADFEVDADTSEAYPLRISLVNDNNVTIDTDPGLTLEEVAFNPQHTAIVFEENMIPDGDTEEAFLTLITNAVNSAGIGVTASHFARPDDFEGESGRLTFLGVTSSTFPVTPTRALTLDSDSGAGIDTDSDYPVVLSASSTAEEVATAIGNAINAASFAPVSPEPSATVTGTLVELEDIKGIDTDNSGPVSTIGGGGSGGNITGLAFLDDVLYAVDDAGGFYKVNSYDEYNLFPIEGEDLPNSLFSVSGVGASLEFIAKIDGAHFSGLTLGPRNVENYKYGNTFFATTMDGKIYALDEAGVLQPVFRNGETSMQLGGSAATISYTTGLAFSTLDYNLWHITENRDTDSGHGVEVSPDETRIPENLYRHEGDTSFWFGLEEDDEDVFFTGWGTTVEVNNAGGHETGTYNMPGGAHGTLTTNEFSLAGCEPQDIPMLYFNYFLETDGNVDYVTDSARVYISHNGAEWTMLASNILTTQEDFPEYNEYDSLPDIGVYNLEDGTGVWRQASVDLSNYVAGLAGRFASDESELTEALSGLRLKFEFSTAGSMNVGGMGQMGEIAAGKLKEGSYLRAAAGNEIVDGDTFELFDMIDPDIYGTFEFDMGYSLVAKDSAGQRIEDGDTITIGDEDSVFEFTKDRMYDGDNYPIFISDGDSASDVAEKIANVVQALVDDDENDFNYYIQPYVKGNRLYLTGATYVENYSSGLTREGDAPGTVSDDNVAVQVFPNMSANQVANKMATVIDAAFAAQDDSAYFQTVKVDGDLLRLIGYGAFINPDSALSFYDILPGDDPGGPYDLTETTQFYTYRRGDDNSHEGFYIDDVIIGYAERGQMVTDVQSDTGFRAVPEPAWNTDILNGPNILVGPYQLEIRTGTDFTDELAILPIRSFDTNDRMTDAITIEAPPAWDLVHGTTFTINDGVYEQTFQFVAEAGDLDGVDPAARHIYFNGWESASEMATKIASAINGAGMLQTNADSNAGGDLVFLADAASVEGISTYKFDLGGQNASAIEAVDLNGDGFVEVITANSNDNTISVMLGYQYGLVVWMAPTFFEVGGMPSDLGVGDLNGDSFLDIVTSNYQDGTVSVLLGKGNGGKDITGNYNYPTFDEQVAYEVGAAPSALELVDVDGDGLLDIVTANKADDTVSILYGNGDGTFDPQVVLGVGRSPMDVAVADIDGNSMPDIVTANSMDDTITVLYEVGQTRFSSQETFAVGGIPVSLAIGDLDGDDAPDIAVANRGDGTVTILINDGSGAFMPDPTNIDVGTGPVALRMEYLDFALVPDPDHPGSMISVPEDNLDFAVVNLAEDMVTVAYGDGLGGFPSVTSISIAGSSPNALAFAAFGNNNPPDMFVTSAETQKFYVNGNSLYGGFAPRSAGYYEFAYGTPDLRYITGDSNEERDQGQIIIRGNEITNVTGWGIKYDSGTRDGDGAELPHPGSVMPQVEVNEQRLVPGITIENNIVASFSVGGILFSGDANNGNVPTAAVPFGRILNNTIYGGSLGIDDPNPMGIGIQVKDNASPTILNNIISTTSVAISVDITSMTTVIGATSYQNNTINVTGTSHGQHDMVLADDAPLFVDASTGNFYPAAGSPVIDSALDSLEDRPALIAVRDPLGIPESPILAPERDLLGQARADDLTVSPPPGLGKNVFKDRGALDRLDFIGPTASVINPMDNQAGLDSDPVDNDVFVIYGNFTEFTIQLADVAGVGIADATVTSSNLSIYVDGDVDPLIEGSDYFFYYDANIDQITLVPATGIWEHGHNYEIVLDNSATGIRDIADNHLRGNRLDKTARFMISVGHIDYGDAPDPPYRSLLENDGARHLLIGGYYLGEGVTSEPDAQFALDIDEVPLWNASGDQMDDGVIFGSALVINGTVHLTVTASRNGGYLDAWIDYNDDGDWDDVGEQIFASQPLGEGENELEIVIPATVIDDDGLNDIVSQAITFARFRYSSDDSGLESFGEALDGEVEDYQVHVVNSLLDFGDAPAPYPTLYNEDNDLSGAYHAVGTGLYLGDAVDDELDGQPNYTATGDDIDDPLLDDEDGVVANNWFVPGQTANITVTASAPGWLNAWIDFNRDGDWNDIDEKILVAYPLVAGENDISVSVPSGAVEGETYARFRFSSQENLDPTGPAPDGEVEDYQFLISSMPYDFGDAPLSYPTMMESGPASLLIEQTGPNNDLLLTAAIGGTEFNQVEVIIVNEAASGDEAFVVFSVADNRLTIDVDPTATKANTVIEAIEIEGTFIATLDSTTDINNNGTGLVSDLGNFGETDGAFDGDGPAAAHHLLGQGLYLGLLVDSETDGQADPMALGDDENGEADEDGVVFGNLVTGQEGSITVTATYEPSFSGTGYLNAWIDFDQDGRWTANEIVISAQPLVNGENELSITIPGDAEEGMTFARFRFSSQPNLSFEGMASDGEVEDYQVEILRGNATISGYKFDDRNYDSEWDLNEPGIAGVTIYVDIIENGILDTDMYGNPIEPFAVTMEDDLSTLDVDETGYYEFRGLMGQQDPYILREIVQDGKARLLIDPAGTNNEIQLVASRAGTDLNDVEVIFVDDVSSGAETAVYNDDDPEAKTLTIHIDRSATTANTVIAVIYAEGTFKAFRSKVSDLNNDGTGLVDMVGSAGMTADGLNDAWKQTYPNATVTLPDSSFGNSDGSYTIFLSEAETLTDVNFGNFHLPVLFVSDIKVAEGDAGYTDLEVTIHQQNSFGDMITVDYWTENGTAITELPYHDYQEATGDLIFPARPAPETPWEQEILTKGFSQGSQFHVSGDYVVWQGRDSDTDDWEIYLFDGTYDANDDPTIIQLTDNDTDDTNPFVVQTEDGVHVVWSHLDEVGDGGDTEIYFYDGTQPEGVPITNNAYDDRDPQVSDSIVVWWATEGMLLDSEIFLYDIEAAEIDPGYEPINLSDNEEDDSNPQVSGNNVVWTGMRNYTHEIILAQYSTDINIPTTVEQITTNNFMTDSEPQIDGEKIVWQRQFVDGNSNSYEIFMYDIEEGGSPVRLTNNAVPDIYPQISGEDIVWQAQDEGAESDWEIMHYNTIAQTAPVNITNNSRYDNRPQISGTQVVWRGFDVADWDVYTYELRGEAIVQNVSQNDDTDWYPQVSGPMIVWRSSGEEDSLIIARAGTPEVTDTVHLRIIGDTNLEADESFFLKIAAASSESIFVVVDDTAEITILNDDGNLDYGDAVDPFYPTLVENDGARHLVGSDIYLGDASGITTGAPDSEDDGLPSEFADGDDLLTGDDEKGVVFDTDILPGGTVQITVTASADCILNSWIDFNRDGDWDDSWADGQEQMFLNEALVAGDNVLTFPVPAGAALGFTYARFRVSSYADIGYTGYVDDGEVEDYYVEITSPDAPATSTSSFSLDGDDGDDTFEFIAGDVPQIIRNGVSQTLPAGAVGEIIINAGAGHDTVILRGNEDDETFELWTDHATFANGAYSLQVNGSETITAISGGGADVVIIHDSDDDDRFELTPQLAQLTGLEFNLRAESFAKVVAVADGQGDDIVDLYDSTGADTFTTTFSSAIMTGEGFELEANGFENVYGHATPGSTDKAVMYDSASGDTANLSPTYAKLYNSSVYNEAEGFEHVRMLADAGGYDIAYLLGSEGNDTLQTGPTYAKMIGDGFYYRVESFDRVTVRSEGGHDTAQMFDSKGDDTFAAGPTLASMRGDGYYIRLENFAEVTGYGNAGGFDSATLDGSADVDSFVATTAYGTLTGQGFSNRAYGFEKVEADGQDGDDTAVLYDSIYGDDLVAADNWVSLSNQNLDFEFLARSFASVEVTSTSEGDKKDVDQSVDFLFAKGVWEDLF